MRSRPYRPLGLPIYVARVPAAPFARCPHSLAATLAALPSMSRDPRAPFRSCADIRRAGRSELKLVRCTRLLGRRGDLYLDHSHGPMLAPAT
jgi:hypothetical protein